MTFIALIYEIMNVLTGQVVEGNETVDTNDLQRYSTHLYNANVVPIPAAVRLFGPGLISLIGVARRKKSYVYKR